MTCTHEKYRQDNYMSADRALAAIRSNQSPICWMSIIVVTCEECGENIAHGERVRVMTVKEVMKCAGSS